MKSWICLTGLVFLAALVFTLRLAGQEQEEAKGKHHRYKFVDIGTFGGPASYINGAMALGAFNQINKHGTAVGSSATSEPAPPDNNLGICGGIDAKIDFVFHAFKWENGAVTDLGALPGDDNCSVATSINANGEIVGRSENGVVDPLFGVKEFRAVLWKDGEITDLGTFGGNYSQVGSINNRGQVAGSATNAILDPFSLLYQLVGSSQGTQTRAFLWEKGRMQDLGTLGGPDAQAFFLNEQGQVAGSSYTNLTPNAATGFPTEDPFLWTKNGGMIDLGTLGGAFASPSALNNRGQVIGQSSLAADSAACSNGDSPNCHPFLWDGTKLIDLTAQSGGLIVTANALNDAGEIVGNAVFPNGASDAYLWKDGAVADLGTLAGDCGSEPFAINSRGQVVGQSFSCASNTVRTFLWENGSMVDLNALIPRNSGWQLVEAFAINDRGEIGGIGDPPGCANLNDAQCGHAYVLIPCDDNLSDEEGCEGDDEATTAAIQNTPAPANQSPVNVVGVGLTPREIAARIHARFGQNRGLGAWSRK